MIKVAKIRGNDNYKIYGGFMKRSASPIFFYNYYGQGREKLASYSTSSTGADTFSAKFERRVHHS